MMDRCERCGSYVGEAGVPTSDNPPPSYHTPSTPQSNHKARTKTESAAQLPPDLPKAVNYLFVERADITGTFVIDPNLTIPAAILPPMQGKGDSQKENLKLVSNKAIQADIWLVNAHQDRLGPNAQCPALLTVTSNGWKTAGDVTIAVHRHILIPFQLDVIKYSGNVTIRLPRSFHGTLTMHNASSIVRSDAMAAQLAMLRETPTEKRYFLGDLTSWKQPGDGCTVTIKSGTSEVRVRYVDEETESERTG